MELMSLRMRVALVQVEFMVWQVDLQEGRARDAVAIPFDNRQTLVPRLPPKESIGPQRSSIAPVPLTPKPKFLKSQGAYLVTQCGGSPQRLDGLRGIDGGTELKGTICGPELC